MSNTYRLERVDSAQSLKEKAYDAIKEAILSVDLEPGAALIEGELAEQLGISKTPVRDALQELEREGFVTRILHKGTYVTDVTLKDLTEVFQLRAVLEGLAARLATPLFTAQQLDQIGADLAAAEAALAVGNLALCSQRGRMLHMAIIDKADNQRLATIIHNLDDHVQRVRVLSDRIFGRLAKSCQEHHHVLAALLQRNPDAAEQAMRGHLFSVLHDLTAPDAAGCEED